MAKAAGNVEWARFLSNPPSFVRRPKRTGSRGRGIKYEERAKKYLERVFGYEFVPGPWLVFTNETGTRYCQPDGLRIDVQRGLITIIEIKYAHTDGAYYQLHALYHPVLRAAFGRQWEFRMLEVVRWYDPRTNFPGHHTLAKDVKSLAPNTTNVHIYRPRGGK